LSEEEDEDRMETLHDNALYSLDLSESNKAINALASFRERALPSLQDLVECSTDSEVRKYAMEAIRRIKQELI